MESKALEAAIVLLLFVVRIGVPIALTLAFGHWLERKLRPGQEPVEMIEKVQVTHKASNIIRLHCWDIKRCDGFRRAQCAACHHPELPCWLALQVEGNKVREQCFTCAFYKPQVRAA